jgi:hypothetical protein
MARELGLGITPWSPLKSGALSGKYTRATVGQVKADRGAFLESFLNEKTFDLIDALDAIARAHDSTVARIALAWVQAQPGVTSTIIGARRPAQPRRQRAGNRRQADGGGARPPRRAHQAQVRVSTEHAGDFSCHPQRRHHGERRLRAGVRVRDREGRSAVLTVRRMPEEVQETSLI